MCTGEMLAWISSMFWLVQESKSTQGAGGRSTIFIILNLSYQFLFLFLWLTLKSKDSCAHWFLLSVIKQTKWTPNQLNTDFKLEMIFTVLCSPSPFVKINKQLRGSAPQWDCCPGLCLEGITQLRQHTALWGGGSGLWNSQLLPSGFSQQWRQQNVTLAN